MNNISELNFTDMPYGRRFRIVVHPSPMDADRNVTIMRLDESLIVTRGEGRRYGTAYEVSFQIKVGEPFYLRWSVDSRSIAHTSICSGRVVAVRKVSGGPHFADPIMHRRLSRPRAVVEHMEAS